MSRESPAGKVKGSSSTRLSRSCQPCERGQAHMPPSPGGVGDPIPWAAVPTPASEIEYRYHPGSLPTL